MGGGRGVVEYRAVVIRGYEMHINNHSTVIQARPDWRGGGGGQGKFDLILCKMCVEIRPKYQSRKYGLTKTQSGKDNSCFNETVRLYYIVELTLSYTMLNMS